MLSDAHTLGTADSRQFIKRGFFSQGTGIVHYVHTHTHTSSTSDRTEVYRTHTHSDTHGNTERITSIAIELLGG